MYTLDEKFEMVKEARSHSYSPYSNFAVGAILILEDGTVIKGCNVENPAFGLCNCAERTAIFSAVAQGYDVKKAVEIVVIADCPRPVSPCGACRQVIAEFMKPNALVTLMNMNKEVLTFTVEQILPYSFLEGDLRG